VALDQVDGEHRVHRALDRHPTGLALALARVAVAQREQGPSTPIFVLGHGAPDDDDDPNITYLSGDIRAAVASARDAAGGRNLLVLGADVARQCVAAGLIDEILVHVAPLLLGDGVRLFGGPGVAPVDLETVSVSQAGQIANLRYRVVRTGRRGRP
jgi:dihydrofolate reductase